MIFNTQYDLINTVANLQGKLYIAGAGIMGKIIGEYFLKNGISWEGFLDIDTQKDGVHGKRVFSYSVLEKDMNVCSICVLISSVQFKWEIYKQLENMGMSEENIFVLKDQSIVYDLWNISHGVYKELERLRRFKGKHKGERCFIVGSGPSLCVNDLEIIKTEISFGLNSIYCLYGKTAWRPTYYCASDILFMRPFCVSGKLPVVVAECEAFFTALFLMPLINSLHLPKDISEKILYYKALYAIQSGKREMRFSFDIEDVVYVCGTITIIAIQLAVYMGFSEIFLLGMDFLFSAERDASGKIKINEGVINHNLFIESEARQYADSIKKQVGFDYVADIDHQLWGYQAARRYADSHGIKIYNATRGGRLEVFDRVDFDSLFSNKKI